MLTHLFLSSSLPLSYFILAVPMRKCFGKHSCMSSFPIPILNDTSFFPAVQLQVHNENPARYGRNTDALVNLNTKLNSCLTPVASLLMPHFSCLIPVASLLLPHSCCLTPPAGGRGRGKYGRGAVPSATALLCPHAQADREGPHMVSGGRGGPHTVSDDRGGPHMVSGGRGGPDMLSGGRGGPHMVSGGREGPHMVSGGRGGPHMVSGRRGGPRMVSGGRRSSYCEWTRSGVLAMFSLGGKILRLLLKFQCRANSYAVHLLYRAPDTMYRVPDTVYLLYRAPDN